MYKINTKYLNAFYITLLIVITAAMFSVSFRFNVMHTWDDQKYILQNKQLVLSFTNIWYFLTNPYYCMYYPVTMFSYMLDYKISGLNGISYHIQNVTWHIIAVVAAYKCFRLFDIKPLLTFVLVLIFAIHPQRVESVVWLSERKDVTCTAFYLWTLYFYIRARKENDNFRLAPLFFCILALLSKPMAVSIPAVLLIYEFYRRQTFNPIVYLKKLWPYFLLLCIFVPVTYLNQVVDADRICNKGRQLYLMLYNLIWIIRKTLIPGYLNPIYPRVSISETYILVIVFYLSLIAILFYLFNKDKKLFIYKILPLLSAYIAVTLPVAGLVPFGSFEQTDRWTYIPSLFILFSAGLFLSSYLYGTGNHQLLSPFIKKTVIPFLSLLYVLMLIHGNYQYQKNWESPYSLFNYSCLDPGDVNPYALSLLCDEMLAKQDYKRMLITAPQFLALNSKNNLDEQEQFMNSLITQVLKGIAYYFTFDLKNAFVNFKAIEPFISRFKDDYKIMISGMLAGCYHVFGDNDSACRTLLTMLSTLKENNDYVRDKYMGFYYLYQKKYNEAIYCFAKHLCDSPAKKIDCESNINIAVYNMLEENRLHRGLISPSNKEIPYRELKISPIIYW